jgi:3-oxoacyl-[acyl-carrier protein] reductase
MAPQDRLVQVNAHLNYPQGLFAGQTAIITGAGQGIGAETARLFANEGAKVVVADIDESEWFELSLTLAEIQFLPLELIHILIYPTTEKATDVVKSINDAGPGRAIAVVGDVTDASYIEKLVKKAAEFGNGKIHIIVNNAGFTWDGVIHKVC